VPRQNVSAMLALVLLLAGLASTCLGGLHASGDTSHGVETSTLTKASPVSHALISDALPRPDTGWVPSSTVQATGAIQMEHSPSSLTRDDGCAHSVLVHGDRSPVRTPAADLQVVHTATTGRLAPDGHSSFSPEALKRAAPPP
jgi:hypothetical protein